MNVTSQLSAPSLQPHEVPQTTCTHHVMTAAMQHIAVHGTDAVTPLTLHQLLHCGVRLDQAALVDGHDIETVGCMHAAVANAT